MIDERLEELASLHALGGLSETEARDFANALRGNVELQRLVAELQAAADALAGDAPLIAPPLELKQKILLQINQRQKTVSFPTESSIARQPVIWLPWALAACFAILCAVLASREISLFARNAEFNRLAESLQNANRSLTQTVLALQETNRMADLRIAMLGSLLADQPKAVAVSLWDEEKQTGIFVVENLKPLPKDKDYQLWVIDPQYGTPVDAGVFQVDDQGKMRLQFKTRQSIKTANKFAVTEEIKGGSPTPKGTMVLIGG